MTFKFGKVQVVTGPTKGKYPEDINEREKQELNQSINRISEILKGNQDWVLSGGLSIPLTFRREFYRKHRDVDIGVQLEYLPGVVKTANIAGYSLFSRKFMTKTGNRRKVELYKEVTPQEVIRSYQKARGHKNLRLFMTDIDHRIIYTGDILDYFDVYPHIVEGDQIKSLEEGLLVPKKYCSGERYECQNGEIITLRHIEYISRLKRRDFHDMDEFDLEKINKFKSGKS